MTYNLKTTHKNVKFGYAYNSNDYSTTNVYSDEPYPLNQIGGSTGIVFSRSGNNLVLGDRIYYGFFYPFASAQDAIEFKIFVNNTQIPTQRTLVKSAVSDVDTVSRSLPLFFTYSASSGDLLSIRFSKGATNVLTIYSGSVGSNFFLWEVEK